MATQQSIAGIDVRFALSAVAGISGLFLLGLAFYGQPAVYLHQAREQWGALMDQPTADQPADLDSDRVVRLRQQVAQLQEELAAKHTAAPATEVVQPPVPVVPAAPQAALPPLDVPQVAAPHLEALPPEP